MPKKSLLNDLPTDQKLAQVAEMMLQAHSNPLTLPSEDLNTSAEAWVEVLGAPLRLLEVRRLPKAIVMQEACTGKRKLYIAVDLSADLI